jgi:membrane-associated phospholipid phosphatase
MGFLSALITVGGSASAVRSGWARPSDAAARAIAQRLRTPERDAFVRVATDLGSLYAVGAVAGAFLVLGRTRRAGDVALAGASAWTVAQAAKRALPRGRPYEVAGAQRLVPVPSGSSWPSGHAAVAVAMAQVLGARHGIVVRSALGMTARLVGLSRIYVGVHHLSDVVAGFGLGTIAARASGVVRRRVS